MGAVLPDTQTMRTWFGVTVRVTIGPGFVHWAGIGRAAIPHPPVANWLLRKGLPDPMRRRLVFQHEFAHFQTAPVVLTFMIVLFTTALLKNRVGLGEILILLSSSQALWEVLSEGLVILKVHPAYRDFYDGIPSGPRRLFWVVGTTIAAAGLLLSVRGGP
jgi:hypothetical protein